MLEDGDGIAKQTPNDVVQPVILTERPAAGDIHSVVTSLYRSIKEYSLLERGFSLGDFFAHLSDATFYTAQLEQEPENIKIQELLSTSLEDMRRKYGFKPDKIRKTVKSFAQVSRVVDGLGLLSNAAEDGAVWQSAKVEQIQAWQEFNRYLSQLYIDAYINNDPEAQVTAQLFAALLSTPFDIEGKEGGRRGTYVFRDREMRNLHGLDVGARAHAAVFGMLHNQPGILVRNPPTINEPGEEHNLYLWESHDADMAIIIDGRIFIIDCKAAQFIYVAGETFTNDIIDISEGSDTVPPGLAMQVRSELGVQTEIPVDRLRIVVPAADFQVFGDNLIRMKTGRQQELTDKIKNIVKKN